MNKPEIINIIMLILDGRHHFNNQRQQLETDLGIWHRNASRRVARTRQESGRGAVCQSEDSGKDCFNYRLNDVSLKYFDIKSLK